MAASSNDWARIAADAGYYDQAHFIAEFRKLVGPTPGAFSGRAGDGADGRDNPNAAVGARSAARTTDAARRTK